jgi:hypothetical protein
VGILKFRIVRVEPRQAPQHGLDLIGEVAFCELAPDRDVERRLRFASTWTMELGMKSW